MLLPRIYKIFDTDDKQLKRYIASFCELLTEIKGNTEFFTTLFDVDKCPVEYLPYLGALLNQELLNQAILESDAREFLKNTVFIYQRKGSLTGIEAYVEAFAGWTTRVVEDTGDHITIYCDASEYLADARRTIKNNLLIQYLPGYIPLGVDFDLDYTREL